MGIKTFSDGNSLPASDINSYLTNSGLVYVTQATIGTAVSTVTVSNCFTSTYDNYKIVISGGAASTPTSLSLKLGASTTGYYGALNYVTYSVGTISVAAVNNAANWPYSGSATSSNINASIDLLSPFAAKTTGLISFYTENATTGSTGSFNGFHNVATSYTDFTIGTGVGNLTGGTITVYGYRKA
jgi:hypothetical protein